MSKDIIVLTPNGRRQKVRCTPDTTILQILEDACEKHGFQPTEYDLKHHNHLLDLTATMRFSNLPNKATLEMVEAERKREETNVTIGLLLEDGERRTADFPPNTNLFDLVHSLAPKELKSLQNPTVMYMRQEVVGVRAMHDKTLRQLGLWGGRAILRLLNKTEEAKQANVSAVYRRPSIEKKSPDNLATPGTSNLQDNFKPVDPVKLIQEVKKDLKQHVPMETEQVPAPEKVEIPMIIDKKPAAVTATAAPSSSKPHKKMSQEDLERRLNIESEVTFLGAQKAVAFTQPDEKVEDLSDLPDDFYDLSIEEVRKLYKDLQQNRMELEDSPLLTTEKRVQSAKSSEQKLARYKNVVVRVQFPDNIILQGVFVPSNTIEDVQKFIREHLNEADRPFHIFTTPLKETLDPKITLLEAKLVPCVHMHFKWMDDGLPQRNNSSTSYLKDGIYLKQTSSEAASLLASKYRSPSRRKTEDSSDDSRTSTSTSKNSKLPKWFKR